MASSNVDSVRPIDDDEDVETTTGNVGDLKPIAGPRGRDTPDTLQIEESLSQPESALAPSPQPEPELPSTPSSMMRPFSTPSSVSRVINFGQNLFKSPVPQGATMLADLFVGRDGVPSMTIEAVDYRMAQLTNIFDRASLTEETYTKLAFAVGKGLDLEIIGRHPRGYGKRRNIFMSLLDTATGFGERFDAIYRSDGDEFFSQPEGKQDGWHMEFLQTYLPEYLEENSKSYTIFTDSDHGNLEFFDREQLWGNCHLQAPILLQWYLTLWQNADLSADNVRIIELSKYIRDTFSSAVLYDYIVEEKGEFISLKARRIMPEAFGDVTFLVSTSRYLTFDSLMELLKERGPALAEMPTLKQSFTDDINGVSRGGSKRQFVLEGALTGENIAGHGLLLVGLHEKDTLEGPQLYLLLQNWWKERPFISVHLDYFLDCGGMLIFSNGEKVEPVTDATYTKLTESIRCAVTLPHLEKGTSPGLGLTGWYPMS